MTIRLRLRARAPIPACGAGRRGGLILVVNLVGRADCFAAVLRRQRASTEADIPIRGGGGQAQVAGIEPALGNAFATAQLLQVALLAADRAGLTSAAHLMAKRRAPNRSDPR